MHPTYFLSHQLLNFFTSNFHPLFMGNRSSHRGGKVVLPDGSVREFDEPLTVAELMLEHPHQVVVELSCNKPSKSQIKLTKPTPLPADNKLEVDKFYLMLPFRRGKLPSFSSQDAHRILVAASTILRAQSKLPSSSRLLPLVARVCAANGASGRRKLVDKDEGEDEDEGFGVGKEYLSRQVSGKVWKPSLDTIEEKREGKKELNMAVLACKVGKRIESKGLVWG